MAKAYMIGVVRATRAAAANRAAQTTFPENVGDNFRIPLWPVGTVDFATTAPSAYTCGAWYIEDTKQSTLLQNFVAEGFQAREATTVNIGDAPRITHNLWLFAPEWTYEQALAALGLMIYSGGEA